MYVCNMYSTKVKSCNIAILVCNKSEILTTKCQISYNCLIVVLSHFFLPQRKKKKENKKTVQKVNHCDSSLEDRISILPPDPNPFT